MSKSTYSTTFHRDGSVTLWNVFTQQYERHHASDLVAACERPFGNLLLPTLPDKERSRVIKTEPSELIMFRVGQSVTVCLKRGSYTGTIAGPPFGRWIQVLTSFKTTPIRTVAIALVKTNDKPSRRDR